MFSWLNTENSGLCGKKKYWFLKLRANTFDISVKKEEEGLGN